MFVPVCRGTGCSFAPFGVWTWEKVKVLGAWFTGGDLGRDVCWLKVRPNGGGQELHEVVGSLGMTFNRNQPQHYTQTGWPAAPPFTGWKLIFTESSTADLDGSQTPNTVGVGNKFTGGSSGGGWIWRYKVNQNTFWNGLNSYKYSTPARPNEMYGPYIDTVIANATTSNICPTPPP